MTWRTAVRSRLATAFALILLTALHASRAVCETPPTAKANALGVSPAKLRRVSDYVDDLVDRGEVPGVVAIVTYKGEVILRKAVGDAVIEPAKRSMKEDAIFRIASMTKPITSVAVMMLAEEGKLNK